ncbi:MAG TPA: RAMP superfamily CRISPR-associated protein [Ktedonobacteraceae bacterium]|nr:RAMP superfamily CRISPR-associated protein [Ktedonobacteraceae bacterium]
MKHFALNLTAMSPLAMRADHAPDGASNAKYIAGSTLMGSLAMVYHLFHDEQSEGFRDIFLKERVVYPNLYPAVFTHSDLRNAHMLPVRPAPQTARTCKRFPGFAIVQDDDPDSEKHGVHDSLFDWAIFKLASALSTSERLQLLRYQKECSHCKRSLKPFLDFYRHGQQQYSPMISATSHTRVQTHTGINRETGTVQDGILYNREVFEERMRFWGLLKVPEELVAPLTDFLDQVGTSGLVRVGTGRSRGLGKVHLSVQPLPDDQYSLAAFKQRLDAFDTSFRERVKKLAPELELGPFYFALTLHSPTILHDDLLRYRTSIDEQVLAELSGLPADSLRAIYQTTGTRRITGWNELWGTPRFHEYALETGSVFFFASDKRDDELLQALFRLEQDGIGQRRAEGFGNVCISDPFHLEVEPK